MLTIMTLKIRFAALLLAFCAVSAYADPPARTGRLNYVHGTVSLAPGDAPDAWAVAPLNRPLTAGDRLWADQDGYAEFHVGSTAVRLAPRSNVDVLTLDDDTLQLRLAQGDINVRVRDVANDTIEIDTPNGAVLLERAGSYRVSSAANGEATNVIVHAGRVQVLAQSGSFAVSDGQHVTLRGPEGAPSDLVAADQDAFDRWCAELDRREDRIAATEYVSPAMTGYEDLDAYGAWRTMPEYGAVWVPRVAAGWAPYRHGHWVWIAPWGWTWVDDAPWGFAPFHYGRWVWLNNYWAWAPGPRIARPVYAPALVAFVGGSQWSVSIGSGPAVGWFPLGWREPYFPWYRASHTYVREVNITQVRNIAIYNNVTRVNYANQTLPQAVTVVRKEAFVSARPVAHSRIELRSTQATHAPIVRTLPAEPVASSFAARRTETRPPQAAIQREVFATRAPQRRDEQASRGSDALPRAQTAAPRVRVIDRQRAEAETPRPRTESPAAPPARATAPSAPRSQRPSASPPRPTEPRVAPERSAAPPAAPQAPRANAKQPERRAAPAPRAQSQAEPRRSQDERREPRVQPRKEVEPRERRAPSSESRPQREPRSEARPAPQARARPEPPGGPPAQARTNAGRGQAQAPHNAPSPRAGGRENRRRND